MRTRPSPLPSPRRSLLALLLLSGMAWAQTTTRLSVSPGPFEGNGFSDFPSISADGRYVAFASAAGNLVAGDTNGRYDIFVRDRQTGATERVSVDSFGAQGNSFSYWPAISADGRYVTFASEATNLVFGDTNGYWDVFIHDRQSGVTELVSVGSLGQGNYGSDSFTISSVSADGRYVAFESLASNLVPGDTNDMLDIFVRDRQSGTTVRVSVDSNGAEGNGWSEYPSISGDGRLVFFGSLASNLVPLDTNGVGDVFVHDGLLGTTALVSVDSGGAQGNDHSLFTVLSADGRFAAFHSAASNLVPGDTNAASDIFLRDLVAGTTERVSVDSSGAQGTTGFGCGQPSISADGRFVAFPSGADLVSGDTNGESDVFLRDRLAGTTMRVSVDSLGAEGNNQSDISSLSADGRFVAFSSAATNLVPGDTNLSWDIFLRDMQTGATTRESVSSGAVQGDGTSFGPVFSDGARYVAFASGASNFVPGDVNDRGDVFVHDFQTGATTLASVSSSGVQGNQHSDTPQVSSDGRIVAFFSLSTTLVPGDANATGDVFVRDLVAGTTEFATLDASGSQVAYGMPGTPVSMSANGRYVAFTAVGPFVPVDTNDAYDVYVRDRTAGTTIRASVGSSGAQGDGQSFGGSLSADGRYAAFSSTSTNLVWGDTNGLEDIFVRDLVGGTTTRVSVASIGAPANGQSLWPSISPDGRYVAFWSDATDLVAGDTNGVFDGFVRDLQTGITTRESIDSNGVQANGMSYNLSLSRGGRYVVFLSEATNLVQGDTNLATDVFLRDRLTGRTTRVNVSTAGVQGDQPTTTNTVPAVSPDGRLVVFDSYATNLVAGDTNAAADVFLRDRGDEAVFAPFCFGDGIAGACPCGNSGAPGRGCQNSAGTGGALLIGTGVPSLANDSAVLTSVGELPSAMSVLLQGSVPVAPVIYGDGLRCTGGLLKRLYTHSALGGAVSFPDDPDLPISARSAAMGAPIPLGATRFYQVQYRDPSPGFCPPPTGNTFNISQGVVIVWGA